jgi:uncharacterized protein YecT (DUF1311 family)
MKYSRLHFLTCFVILSGFIFCSGANGQMTHHFYRIYRVAENMYPKNSADHRLYAAEMDSVLNYVYNGILRDYKSDTAFTKSLRAAELAWLKFRDASLESIISSSRGTNDATIAQCRSEYFSTITRRRIEELNEWYSGTSLRNDGGMGYVPENLCSSYHTEKEQQLLHTKQK